MTTTNHTPITTGAAANASTFNSPMGELDAAVGNLSTLTTTAKSSAVAAINEVKGNVGTLSSLTTTQKGSAVGAINELDGDIGILSSLITTAKTSLVAAINELFNSIAKKTTNRSINLTSESITFADSYVQINSVSAPAEIHLPSISSFGAGREITILLAVDPGLYTVQLIAASGENIVGPDELVFGTAYTYRAAAAFPGRSGLCWVTVNAYQFF